MTDLPESVAQAQAWDQADPLRKFRDQFSIPRHGSDDQSGSKLYLCGNSLGLQPKSAVAAVRQELDDWARLGVDGHFEGEHPWMPYHEFVRDNLAELVGAKPKEVVAMNSLTVNLHLMMVSFYRPTTTRYRIVMERQAFPSDRYAMVSQLRARGLDVNDALVELEDFPGAARVSTETLDRYLANHGDSVALVLMPGVQYLSGQLQDMAEVCELAHKAGAVVGLDLAHAVGNVPLQLHDWGADFAVWCSYKYLNSGPGAVAGCFVHERHLDRNLNRFAGWWGHRKDTRFKMGPEFEPEPTADGWQLSNPPVLALAPLRASLEIFHQAQMGRLREKSIALTGALHQQLKRRLSDHVTMRTPIEPHERGCQLSLQLQTGATKGRQVFDILESNGVVSDWREPDVIRVAPAPLYNTMTEVFEFVDHMERAIADVG